MLLSLKSKERTTVNKQGTTNFILSQPGGIKYPYLLLLLITFGALALSFFYYFTGHDALVHWVKTPQLQTVDALINQFTKAGQEFPIKANGYLISERFDISLPFINVKAAHIFLAFMAVCLAYFLTVASTLKKWPFLVSMLLLMFFLVSANFNALDLISGFSNYALLPVMLGLALPAYAFQAFFPQVCFLKRLAVFVILVLVLGTLIFLRSPYRPEVTSLHLINHLSQAFLVASCLFIMWVAIEIIHFLVWLNTQARNPERRFKLWQFMLVAFLYLGNLLLLYLEEAGVLYLDLVYLDAFIILFLSAIAGFWGLRKREEVYGNLVNFWPGAAFLFLIFATLTFLSIGYAFATANDPLILAYRSIILYIHLALGAVFFLYVMMNFGRLMGERLQVYKVIYDPKRLPFYTVYLLGTIATFGLFVKTNGYTYRQIKAAYYNYLGDLYQTSGENLVAERFYQESNIFDRYNVKSNLSLAGISREKNFRSTEIVYLKEALRRGPNEKVYARLASLFDEKPYFFEQQYTLKEGLNHFPESGKLLNNMALLYDKTALADSTLFYFNLAENFSGEKEVVRNNKLAFFIKNGLPEQANLIVDNHPDSKYLPFRSNTVLLKHLSGLETAQPVYPEAGETLQPGSFTLLYHSVLNRLHAGDTSALQPLNNYLQTPENDPYSDDLSLLRAALQQYNSRPLEAKQTLEFLSRNVSAGGGYYEDIIGLWLLEYDLYEAAAAYFAKARENGFPEAGMHEAQALALSGKKAAALAAARNLLQAENPEIVRDAGHLITVLEATPEQAIAFKDESQKVLFMGVQPLATGINLEPLLSTIRQEETQAAARNLLAGRYLKQREFQKAETMMRSFKPVSNTVLDQEQNRLFAEFWIKTNQPEMLEKNLEKLETGRQHEQEKLYYKALIAEKNGKANEAKTLYDQAAKVLPYHEDALLAASGFYRDVQKDDLQAYNILMTGIAYNPFSAPLYRAYVLQSLRTGFESYAASGMEQLQPLISAEEYATFNRQYQAELAKIKALTEGWD